MTDQLNHLRQRFGQLLVLVFWCHVPILGMVAMLAGTMPVAGAMLIGAVMAAIYQVTWYRAGTAPVTRHVAAVLLIGQPSLLLVLLQGHMWQMDMHMYFFAMIALNIACSTARPWSSPPRPRRCITLCFCISCRWPSSRPRAIWCGSPCTR